MGPTVTQDSASYFRAYAAMKRGRILRNKMSNFTKRRSPGAVRSNPASCACIPTMGKRPKSLIPFSVARSAVSAAQNPFALWAACQQTYSEPENEACCSGSAVSFVVTSFTMMSASERLCLSAGQEQPQSCEQNAKQRLTDNRLLLLSAHVRLYYSCLSSLFSRRLGRQKLRGSSQHSPSFIANLRVNLISHVSKFKLVTALVFRLVSLLNTSMKAI